MSGLFGLRASPWFNLDKHRGDSPSVIRFAPHSRDSPRVRGDEREDETYKQTIKVYFIGLFLDI